MYTILKKTSIGDDLGNDLPDQSNGSASRGRGFALRH
jgi:hypothetical protein